MFLWVQNQFCALVLTEKSFFEPLGSLFFGRAPLVKNNSGLFYNFWMNTIRPYITAFWKRNWEHLLCLTEFKLKGATKFLIYLLKITIFLFSENFLKRLIFDFRICKWLTESVKFCWRNAKQRNNFENSNFTAYMRRNYWIERLEGFKKCLF